MTISARNSGLALTASPQTACTALTGNASMAKLWVSNVDGVNTHPVSLSFYDLSAAVSYTLLASVPVFGRQTRQLVMPLVLEDGDYLTAVSDGTTSLHVTSALQDYSSVDGLTLKNAVLAPSDTAAHTLYTCPASTVAMVRLLVANTDTLNRNSVTLQWTDTSAAQSYYLALNCPVDPMTSEEFDIPLVLEAGDTISVTAGTANTITVFASIEVKG